MTEVKICGLKYPQDIKAVNRYKPEYIGMVMFCPKSSRNVDTERAKELLSMLDKTIKSVAVTVSPSQEQIGEIERAGFDFIQIHGDVEDDTIRNCTLPVIRAINVGSDLSDNFQNVLEKTLKWDNIYGILFDAGTPGSGETFDWERLVNVREKVSELGARLFLAGGLNPENVAQAAQRVKPDAVDVSSGVEYDDRPHGSGKDEEKIKNFIFNVRSINNISK